MSDFLNVFLSSALFLRSVLLIQFGFANLLIGIMYYILANDAPIITIKA